LDPKWDAVAELRLDVNGQREIGVRRAIRRLFGLPLAIAPLDLGLFAIIPSPTRRGWHDHLAGTSVVYDDKAPPRSLRPPDGRCSGRQRQRLTSAGAAPMAEQAAQRKHEEQGQEEQVTARDCKHDGREEKAV